MLLLLLRRALQRDFEHYRLCRGHFLVFVLPEFCKNPALMWCCQRNPG